MSDNRINSAGAAPLTPTARTSQVIRNVLAAGATLAFPVNGNFFYVTFASNPITIKPNNRASNQYVPGTGLELDISNTFSVLELKNTLTVAVVFEIFVGFDRYIDNRVIIAAQSTQQVSYPTNPTASATTAVAITDRSGQVITDINGTEWYAVNREGIYVFNPDAGVTLLLQKAGASTSSGPAVGIIYPLTTLRYPAAGNYSLSVGGGAINVIVSEIYNALPKLTA